MIVLLFLLLLLLAGGCGNTVAADNMDEVVEETENPYGSIDLSHVQAPKFEEDFATLYSGMTTLVVYWGTGGNSFMWAESGYPGFDYPMVIETDVPIEERACVYLQTQWGQYEYKCVTSGEALQNGDNLVDLTTQESLILWGRKGEQLVIWNRENGHYIKFELCGGTEIAT